MRTFSSELQDALASGISTLCHCWRLVRMDGAALGFTDHDRPVTFDGQTYEPGMGLEATEAVSHSGFAIGGLDVAGAINSVQLTEEDLSAGLLDNALIEMFIVDWQNVETRARLRKGNLGDVTRGDHAFHAEIRGLIHNLDQEKGRRVTKSCDAMLGDRRCMVDLSSPAYRGEGTITRVLDPLTYNVSGLGLFQTGWFSRGLITFEDGDNANTVRPIAFHGVESGVVQLSLWKAPPKAIEPGVTVRVTAGCDQRFETCRLKFANGINFRGFPKIPGNNFAFSYASGADQNDGGSLS